MSLLSRLIISIILFALATLALWIVQMRSEPAYTASRYFPARIDDFKQQWYSEHLSAMNETSIYNLAPQDGRCIFRFIWLRTFHHPMCVRLEHNKDGKTFLYGKELNGAGGYEPGVMIADQKVELSEHEYEALKQKLDSINFVRLPTNDRNIGGEDGSQWIFELNNNGRYHVIDRWSPKGPIQDLGRWLLDVAKLTPSDHFY